MKTPLQQAEREWIRKWETFKHKNFTMHSVFWAYDKKTTIKLFEHFLMESLAAVRQETESEMTFNEPWVRLSIPEDSTFYVNGIRMKKANYKIWVKMRKEDVGSLSESPEEKVKVADSRPLGCKCYSFKDEKGVLNLIQCDQCGSHCQKVQEQEGRE